MGLLQDADQKRYLYILKDGKMHEKVDEGTEGAKLRVHENKDGTTIEKWEKSYPGISGVIQKVMFRESDYGTNVNIEIKDEDDNEFVLSLKASSKYGEMFMEALPNIDTTQEVLLKSYSFPDKNNPERRVQGLTIEQGGEKVRSYFNTYDEATKTWSTTVDGYPTPDSKKKYTTEKWKLFFAERNIWLQEYLVEAKLVEEAQVQENSEEKEDEDGF
jgi:hypothetical protein